MLKLKQIKMLPAREQVASILRQAILSGDFVQGQWLTLDAVAQQVGMSRTPVREAFQLLASEGLIRLLPNRGAQVLGITPETIRDHYEIRLLLEDEAIARASRRKAPLDKLRQAHSQGQAAILENDPEGVNDANQAFHLAIWEASGSEKLKFLLSHLWNGLSMDWITGKEDLTALSQQDHERILIGLASENEQEARLAIRAHVHRSMETLLSHYPPPNGDHSK
ncbi:MAG: GntR family transcriptional regulator [Christensenellales bacterium]|jgi:DNA-binding GntR family transcriptional regulator